MNITRIVWYLTICLGASWLLYDRIGTDTSEFPQWAVLQHDNQMYFIGGILFVSLFSVGIELVLQFWSSFVTKELYWRSETEVRNDRPGFRNVWRSYIVVSETDNAVIVRRRWKPWRRLESFAKNLISRDDRPDSPSSNDDNVIYLEDRRNEDED